MDHENMWKIIRENKFEVNDDIDQEFLCTICKKILIKACNNGRCGCRYCNECINQYLREGEKMCPGESEICVKNEVIDIDRDIHIDQRINYKISKLLMKCPNDGCRSQVELKSMETHLRVCEERCLRCPYHHLGCKENKLTSEKVEEHISKEIHSHMRLLVEWMINSQNFWESQKMDVDQLRSDNHDLKEMMKNQTCDIARLKSDNEGLKETMRTTENVIRDLQKSEKENTEEILKLGDEMSALKNDNRRLKGELITVKNQIEQLVSNLVLEPKMKEQRGEIEKFNSEMMALRKENESLKEEVETMENEEQETYLKPEPQSAEICQSNQSERKSELTDKVEIQIRDIEIKLGEMSRVIDALKTESNTTTQSIVEMQEIVDNANYGEFVWKIENWSEKREEAQSGLISDVYSDSFFSNRNGYKMFLRIDPDGIGEGKGHYLSIFFCIMKGPFDGILHWPFKREVEISLINQQSGVDHVTDTMRCYAYPDNEAFMRPINEFNIGHGVAKFIKLEEISTNLELSRDNQIFIKCSVKPPSWFKKIIY